MFSNQDWWIFVGVLFAGGVVVGALGTLAAVAVSVWLL